jgi:ribosomal protein S18 acetylase RimI-like enzyme
MARVMVDTWFATHNDQISEEALRQRRNEWGYTQSEQGWRRAIRQANGETEKVLIATHESQVVAVTTWKLASPDRAEVTTLYVDVAHQRSGIGSRLVDMAIGHFSNLGVPALHIAVLATNNPARSFYESQGGRICGTREHTEGQEVVYAWKLNDMQQDDE